MFIGHFAVGFAGKRLAPRTDVALLIAAALFLDILWPIFVLLGWEQVRIDPGNTRYTPLDFVYYPWSHSLLMSMLWGEHFQIGYVWALPEGGYELGVVWAAIIAVFAVLGGGRNSVDSALWQSKPARRRLPKVIWRVLAS